jgi:two-component system CheB/CheR fusion protein
MSTLIRDVLNFSSIDNESNAFLSTDLNEIINNVILDFSLLIEEKKARILVSPLPVADVIPIQFNQLFYNLISNSLKFARSETAPVVNVTWRRLPSFEVSKYPSLSKGVGYLEILIEDNGIGFDQKHSEKIFEIFQRLDNRNVFSGTGIGLALCKKIIANHNGEIFVESRPNEGALFHIILPFKHSTSAGDMPEVTSV